MKKKLTDNWLLKIASLVFAFCLWLIVINIDDPYQDKGFANIPVKFVNADILTEQGLVYEVLDGTNTVKTVTVYAPRSIVDQLDKSDLVAEADFKNLKDDNTIPISFSSNRLQDKIRDLSGNISSVKLNIEEEKTIRLVLKVNAIGTVAEGYMVGNVTSDQNRVVVTGPKSIISRINKAVAEVDVADATVGIATYVDVKLYDEEDNLIESDSITQNVETVRASVEVLALKTVSVEYSVMGTPAAGYLATGVIESDPSSIMIAGPTSTINNITKIEIPEEALNITGQSKDMMAVVDIEEYLPTNIILADSSFNGKASVTVHIEQAVADTVTVKGSAVHVINVPEGFSAKIEGIDDEIDLDISGLASDIEEVVGNDIIGYVDLEDVMKEKEMEELRAGTYTATVTFSFSPDIKIENSITAKVVVEKSED